MWDRTKLILSSEISEKVTKNSVEFAQEFGEYLGTDEMRTDPRSGRPQKIKAKLTTSQLRKFFGEVKRQQMNQYNETEFILLKPKLAYAVARSEKNSKIEDFYLVISNAMNHVKDQKSFDNFIMIFEAIVAYHKAAEEQKTL